MTNEEYLSELSRFSDLDFVPKMVSVNDNVTFILQQQGEDVRITMPRGNDRVIEVRGEQRTVHRTYRGLLMSQGFGNLKRFVDSQKALILREAPYIERPERYLPIEGSLDDRRGGNLFEQVNEWLEKAPSDAVVRALVIDGPAGIGKTHLIRQLAYQRAVDFGPGTSPPVLHVQSRGRKLTTLNDVIAGTLQAMRIGLTYDQVPILARHGLLVIGIDGFDELADPNGYDTAWGSLRDLAEELIGLGSLILAGRDTFLNVDDVKKALPILDSEYTNSAHLTALSPQSAFKWLSDQGCPQEKLKIIEDAHLFYEGSYALRPIFISHIAGLVDHDSNFEDFLTFPLKALVEAMVLREARILSGAIRDSTGADLQALLSAFFREVSRDMSDAESDSIDAVSLTLISDIVFSGSVSEDDIIMLRHRASALAMLEPDGNLDRRKFPHTEIQDYFLGQSYLRLIGNREVPKSIRRNIIGSDFLDTFHDISTTAQNDTLEKFFDGTAHILREHRSDDRTRKNLPALALAALSDTYRPVSILRLDGLDLDEIVVRGSISGAELSSTEVSRFDARGANISGLSFADCVIASLLADSSTVIPTSFPTPGELAVEEFGRARKIHDSRISARWLIEHSPEEETRKRRPNEYLMLFEKLCRITLRQNWVRNIDDDRAGRLLDDVMWPTILQILEGQDLVTIRHGVGVGGPRSDFIRIHRPKDFLDPTCRDPLIAQTLEAIEEAGRAII